MVLLVSSHFPSKYYRRIRLTVIQGGLSCDTTKKVPSNGIIIGGHAVPPSEADRRSSFKDSEVWSIGNFSFDDQIAPVSGNGSFDNTSSSRSNKVSNQWDPGNSNFGSATFDDEFHNPMLGSSTFGNAPFDNTSFYNTTHSANGFLIGNSTPWAPASNSNAFDNFAFGNAAYKYVPLDTVPLGNVAGLQNEYIDSSANITNQIESISFQLSNGPHRAPRELLDIPRQTAHNMVSQFMQSYNVNPHFTEQILPTSPPTPSPGLNLQGSEGIPCVPSPHS